MAKQVRVYIHMRDCGAAFGGIAEIRSARTGRILWESRLYPYGMRGVGYRLAQEELAARDTWIEVSGKGCEHGTH